MSVAVPAVFHRSECVSIPLLYPFASVVLSLAMTSMASAAPSPGQSHPCAGIADASDRLGCYDAAFSPAADAQPSAADLQAGRERALTEFGLNPVQLREREPDRMRVVAPDRIEATIARVGSRPTGERMVTLDSGQVWLLTDVTTKGHLKNGDKVVIRKAAMGSYMLLTPSQIPLRARRVQ